MSRRTIYAVMFTQHDVEHPTVCYANAWQADEKTRELNEHKLPGCVGKYVTKPVELVGETGQ